jgi:hypothetical protein
MLQKRDGILPVEAPIRKMRVAQENDLMAGLAVVFVDVFKNKMVVAQGDPRTEFFQKLPLQRIAPSLAEFNSSA